jgi:plastocyanin
MRIRVGALIAGLVTAALVAGFPASAANTTIAAMSVGYSWNPKNVTIHAGDTGTWTTDGALPHNVCVQKPGTTGTTCDEFRNGDPSTSWSSYTNSHTFTTPGTYNFYCEVHKSFGMVGTITVEGDSTGTGTYPAETTTTQTQTTPSDTVAPHFTSKPKRRASRKSLIVEFGASEAGKLSATVFRRPPGKRSFSRVGSASLTVKQGHDVVTLPRRASGRLRKGAYRVTLQLVDAAGNKSATKTLLFKLA